MTTDLMKIAVERRDRLQRELALLDEFIATGERLMRDGPGGGVDEAEEDGGSENGVARFGRRRFTPAGSEAG